MSKMGQNINVDVDSGHTTRYIIYGVVVVGVLALAYFGVINPILKGLNIKDTKDEKKGKAASDKLNRKQVLSPALYRDNKEKVTITSGQANTKATSIYNGKGTVWDDEPMGVGAVTSAGSLVNISYVSHVFNNVYGKDMESYLNSYLEPKDWTDIDNYIEKTKKF